MLDKLIAEFIGRKPAIRPAISELIFSINFGVVIVFRKICDVDLSFIVDCGLRKGVMLSMLSRSRDKVVF